MRKGKTATSVAYIYGVGRTAVNDIKCTFVMPFQRHINKYLKMIARISVKFKLLFRLLINDTLKSERNGTVRFCNKYKY